MSMPTEARKISTKPERRALLRAIDQLHRCIQDLTRQLDQLDADQARAAQISEAFDSYAQAGLDAQKLVASGVTRTTAIARISGARALPPETVAFYLDQALAHKDAHLRALRDREILAAARKGASNQELAKRYGISARQVSRIIGKAFRRA